MTTNNVINNNLPNGNLFVSLNLTSNNILNAFATPIQILPRPGAGKAYVCQQSQLILFFGTTNYADGGTPQLQYETNTASVNSQFDSTVITSTVSTSMLVGAKTFSSSMTNQAMFYSNDTAAFTLGDGTARVNLWYYILEIG